MNDLKLSTETWGSGWGGVAGLPGICNMARDSCPGLLVQKVYTADPSSCRHSGGSWVGVWTQSLTVGSLGQERRARSQALISPQV